MKQTDANEQWARARELFLEIADADAAARAAALGRIADESPALRELVERLLEQDLGPEPESGAEAAQSEPERIGNFVLLERIGEGGFGTVHRARQEAPFEREVALKILKPGLASPHVLARFADERKYLSRIDHPDVVKILDAGSAPDGRLYVAMELVRGELITTFVRKRGIGLRGRVALVARVARAVHHVHQRAIIHRDLKPSNILVTEVDGKAQPRIIDFGIATAVSEADRAGWTQMAGPVFTPSFASPEQVAGSDRIDIRADVYALGGVLCELLTGKRPRERITVTETPARAPSTLVPPGDGQAVSQRSLRGDLDRIVLKCVAWDPEERYDSAAALADDLDRYLRNEPVLATPPSRRYLMHKFVRRHRIVVGACALAVVAVLVGLVLAVDGRARAMEQSRIAMAARKTADDEADRARAEGERAAQSLDDAIAAIDEMLRQGADEDLAANPGTDPARRKLVLHALGLYESLLARERENPQLTRRVIVAQIHVAQLQHELGALEAAVLAAKRSIELCEQPIEGASANDLLASALFTHARSLYALGRMDEFRAARENLMRTSISPDEDVAVRQWLKRTTIDQMNAQSLRREGDVEGARRVLEDLIDSGDELVARWPERASLLSEQAMSLHLLAYFEGFLALDSDYAAKFERAVELLERARDIEPESPGFEHRLAKVLSNWAHVDIKHGQAARAAPRAARAADSLARLAGDFPLRETYLDSYLANAQRLSWAHRFSGDQPEAERIMQEAIEVGLAGCERLSASDGITFLLAMLQSELARHVSARDEFDRAGELWLGAQTSWETILAPAEPQLPFMIQAGVFYDNFARYQDARGQLEEAEASARKANEWHERMLDRTGDNVHAARLGKSLPLLAQVQIHRGRPADAVQTLQRGVDGGFVDRETLDGPEYDELREREDFLRLLRP